MFDEANRVARSFLLVTFQAWMSLSLLQLFANNWSELLKDFRHRFPRTRQEYMDLQQSIFHEMVLANNIFDSRSHARIVVGASGGRSS